MTVLTLIEMKRERMRFLIEAEVKKKVFESQARSTSAGEGTEAPSTSTLATEKGPKVATSIDMPEAVPITRDMSRRAASSGTKCQDHRSSDDRQKCRCLEKLPTSPPRVNFSSRVSFSFSPCSRVHHRRGSSS